MSTFIAIVSAISIFLTALGKFAVNIAKAYSIKKSADKKRR